MAFEGTIEDQILVTIVQGEIYTLRKALDPVFSELNLGVEPGLPVAPHTSPQETIPTNTSPEDCYRMSGPLESPWQYFEESVRLMKVYPEDERHTIRGRSRGCKDAARNRTRGCEVSAHIPPWSAVHRQEFS